MVRVHQSLCLGIATFTMLCGAVLGQVPNGANPQGAAGAPRTANPPMTGAIPIGVIDIGYIFDNHPIYKQQQEAIDAEIKNAETEINARRDALQREVESLRLLNESSAEYRAKETDIANQDSQLKLEFLRKEKEFGERKAMIIAKTYEQIQQLTQQWAQHNGIQVVLRYSRIDMDVKRPQSVNMGVLREVVYFNPSLDLTDSILNYIRSSAPASVAGNNGQNKPGVR